MKQQKRFGMNVGISSILITIVILCLVCFAGLSIISANADLTLSRKLADRETAYYDACNKAQEALLAASKKESPDDSFSFSYPVQENQMLQVTATYSGSDGNSNPYEITSWKLITVETPEYDQSLSLLFGN